MISPGLRALIKKLVALTTERARGIGPRRIKHTLPPPRSDVD